MLPRDHAEQTCLHNNERASWFAGVSLSNMETSGFKTFN
jgi:hypothetical protein